MIKSMNSLRLSILATLAMLVACQTMDEANKLAINTPISGIQTSTPMVTVTAMVPSSTVQPSPTINNTKTPYPPTPIAQDNPDIFKSPVAKDLLFSNDETCRLPCWYGLRVGTSQVGDILHSLRQAVGAPDDYVFLMGEDPQSQLVDPGYISFRWKGDPLPEGRPALFTINTYFNPQTDMLSFLQIHSTIPAFTKQTLPQHVLKELGQPSDVRILFQTIVEDVSLVSLDIVILYEGANKNEAMDFNWITYIPVDITNFPNDPRVAKWCLNGSPNQIDANFTLQIPILDSPEARAELQNDYGSIEIFGITVEELYERVLKEENTCLTREF